jgi:hypothetical protein
MARLSKHAEKRSKQRSIQPKVIEWLYDYGTPSFAGEGAERLIFDKSARRRLRRDLGNRIYRQVEQFLDAYVIRSSDGDVITCGWLTPHVQR